MIYPTDDYPRPSLDQAIAAARAGQRNDAVQMLRQILERDPDNADAWMWLGGIAPDAHEQRQALERAVEIAPHNRRAQRGLQWLRETQPHVFEAPIDKQPTEGRTMPEERRAPVEQEARPRDVREVDHAQLAAPAERPAPDDVVTQQMPVADGTAPVTPAERPSPDDVVTQQMPVVNNTALPAPAPTDRTARMPASSEPRPDEAHPRPLFSDVDARETQAVRLPPPEDVSPYEYAPGANFARWLLAILWALGLGAVATTAAIFIFSGPAAAEQLVQSSLAQVGLIQPPPGEVATLYSLLIGGLVALAVIDLLMMIGLVLRRGWAWTLNLLVALIITAGTVALFVLLFGMPPTATDGLTWDNPAVQTTTWLLVFALLFLFLSFASRRAFRKRRDEEVYGR